MQFCKIIRIRKEYSKPYKCMQIINRISEWKLLGLETIL